MPRHEALLRRLGWRAVALIALRTVVYRIVIADNVLGAQEWNVDA